MHSALGKRNYGCLKMKQLILGTGTDIWWLIEPDFIHLSLLLLSDP
jgi:hypothetical protein